jgi:hypothetical protein
VDTILKAIGGYSALAGFVALLTGATGVVGKFGNVWWILFGMYVVAFPVGLTLAAIGALKERYDIKALDMTDKQAVLVFGLAVFGGGLIVRYTLLDSEAQHPTHAAAVGGAVLLAVPFAILAFRKLGAAGPDGQAATLGDEQPAVSHQATRRLRSDGPSRLEKCPACGSKNRIPKPGLLKCGHCGTQFEALASGGVRHV